MKPERVNPRIDAPELRPAYERAPGKVVINDVTLREGEQSEGVSFSQETKVELAQALERCGVDQIQVGYPGRFERDRESIKAIAAAVSKPAIEAVALAFVEDWEAEIDACLESGAEAIAVVFRSSPRLQKVLGVTPAEAVARTEAAVGRVSAAGDRRISFLPSDSTRAEPAHLEELWKAAASAGADQVYVADSMGAGTPELIGHLVDLAGACTGLPVGVHCHNDFGLVVANTVAGVNAGAKIVDVAVNGLGDRAGNAPLEEVVAALELLYGIETGVNLASLTGLSRRFATASGRPLHDNKPISGAAVFSHTLPTHRSAIELDRRSIQAFEPEIVGNDGRLGERPEA